jgi:putative transposase
MEGLYHVWFSTKGRKQGLDGDLGDEVTQLLREIAQRPAIGLLEIALAGDHAHLLLTLSGDRTLSSAMHQLKGAASRQLFLRHPELKIDIGHNSFWQKGYGWRKIDPTEAPAVRHYIRTQANRPLRHAG